MADTFDLQINCLEKTNSDGIVFNVHWSLFAERNTGTDVYSANCYGSVGLPAPEGNIIPYEDLTPEIVCGWLKDLWGEEAYENYCQGLSNQIDQQEFPTESAGLPWENSAEEAVIID